MRVIATFPRRKDGGSTMVILIGIWLLALGIGGWYYGQQRWGFGGGAGIGVGTIMLVLLTVNLLGVYH